MEEFREVYRTLELEINVEISVYRCNIANIEHTDRSIWTDRSTSEQTRKFNNLPVNFAKHFIQWTSRFNQVTESNRQVSETNERK